MKYVPHSVATEQAVIGAMMYNNKMWHILKDFIKPDDFYVPLYAHMFSVIGDLIDGGKEAWPESVRLKLMGSKFEDACTPEELRVIVSNATMINDVERQAAVLLELAQQRRMIKLGGELVAAAEAGDGAKCEAIKKLIDGLAIEASVAEQKNAVEQAREAFTSAEETDKMMKTGLFVWDTVFGGLNRGARYIIGGRGGAGKTALALNLAWNIAKQGGRARYIYFEGTENQIWWRIMARETGVPMAAFLNTLTDKQKEQAAKCQDRFIGPDFVVVKDPRNVNEMVQRCGVCDVIVLDGMSSAPANGDNLIDRIADVSRYAKTLADRTGATVILLAHMNSQGVKNGGDGTGLFGGQAPTFDPEGIIELSQKGDGLSGEKMVDGVVTKNRYGLLQTVKFIFNGNKMEFRDGM